MSSYKIRPVKTFKWRLKKGHKPGPMIVLSKDVEVVIPDELAESDALELIEANLAQYVEGKGEGLVASTDDLDDELDSDVEEKPAAKRKAPAKPKSE